MVTERQKAFRQEYRSRIMGWYDGYLHIVIIYAMGAAAFYIYLQHIQNVTPLEWLTIPITFLFTNIFEWAIHRFVMHRPVPFKGLRAIYERHTLNHHQFFTDEEMRFRDHKDWRVTVFPPYALVVFILMSMPGGIILGNLFTPNRPGVMVKKLEPMPAKPTLQDFFRLRFAPANHVLQSATRAMKTGMTEEVILACLLHDTVQAIIKTDHGWWGAQLFEPYIPEKSAFGIRYHQALRFYEDKETGYEYPDLYRNLFGIDYVPPPHIQETYKMVRKHKWYMEPRLVTVNDLYAFDPQAVVSLDPFIDIIGRHFKQPKEGLGNDNSPVAHMWRTIANPDTPL